MNRQSMFGRIAPNALVALILLAGQSCASLHRSARSLVSSGSAFEHVRGNAPSESPKLYQEAVRELEAQDFAAALQHFDEFLKQNPTSPWTQAANLNSGRALEGLKLWTDAIQRYRSVIQATAKAQRLRAMALYRLSFCYEALGDDTQVIVSLNDLMSRTDFLPREVGQAELPAKLASAYARIGNFDSAQDFYKKAEIGIARLRQDSKGAVPSWLPETLYSMGETSRRQLSWTDFETSIRPLARGQLFLLQASDLNQSPWSERASEDLISIYNDLFDIILQAPVGEGDPLIARRALQNRQWSRVGLILDLMAELRARTLPDEAVSPQTAKTLAALEKLEKRIQGFLMERPAGEGLTAEAKSRLKNRAALRVESVDDQSLEQAFIKSSQQAPSSSALVPAPEPTPSENHVAPIRITPPSPEDPNL